MSNIYKDRCQETSSNTPGNSGTVTVNLSGTATTNNRTFTTSGYVSTNTVQCHIFETATPTNWVDATCTFTSGSPNTLTFVAANVFDGSSGAGVLPTWGGTVTAGSEVTAADSTLWTAKDFLSGLGGAEISITGAATATIGRQHVCSGTSANYTLTLPAASGNAGKSLSVRMDPALTKLVTLDGNASEKINNALTRVMWANESATLDCDGSNWFKRGGLSIPMGCAMAVNANATLANATNTQLALGTILTDNTGLMGSTSGNGKINILRPSTYDVLAILSAAGLAINGLQDRFRVTGGTYYIAGTDLAAAATFLYPNTVPLALGDYVELWAYQASGISKTLYSDGTASGCNLVINERLTW